MSAKPKFAHVVFQTSQQQEMRDWYCTVLDGHVVYQDQQLCFITFDDEHHRVALLTPPMLLERRGPTTACTHHVAYTFDNLDDLLDRYVLLRDNGVRPAVSIAHGVTTSLYYQDPEGNFVENADRQLRRARPSHRIHARPGIRRRLGRAGLRPRSDARRPPRRGRRRRTHRPRLVTSGGTAQPSMDVLPSAHAEVRKEDLYEASQTQLQKWPWDAAAPESIGNALLELMAGICAPVTIVTAADTHRPYGATVSSVAALSLDPPWSRWPLSANRRCCSGSWTPAGSALICSATAKTSYGGAIACSPGSRSILLHRLALRLRAAPHRRRRGLGGVRSVQRYRRGRPPTAAGTHHARPACSTAAAGVRPPRTFGTHSPSRRTASASDRRPDHRLLALSR